MDVWDLPVLEDGMELKHGLLDNVGLGIKAMAGFPTLHTIPHTFKIDFAKVRIFNMDSQ
jgi:5'-3' exoribonuclease 1